MTANQQIFSPIHYRFMWTEDGSWYTWDRTAAHKDAMKARDAAAREFKAAGRKVKKFSLPGQLVRVGGIGSGKPDIEAVVTCYGVNAY